MRLDLSLMLLLFSKSYTGKLSCISRCKKSRTLYPNLEDLEKASMSSNYINIAIYMNKYSRKLFYHLKSIPRDADSTNFFKARVKRMKSYIGKGSHKRITCCHNESENSMIAELTQDFTIFSGFLKPMSIASFKKKLTKFVRLLEEDHLDLEQEASFSEDMSAFFENSRIFEAAQLAIYLWKVYLNENMHKHNVIDRRYESKAIDSLIAIGEKISADPFQQAKWEDIYEILSTPYNQIEI